MAQLPDGRALPGKLFIVEGIDGSGKSTQLDLLSKWLLGEGYCLAHNPLRRRVSQQIVG